MRNIIIGLLLFTVVDASAQWVTDPQVNTEAVVQRTCADPIARAVAEGSTMISFRMTNGGGYGVGYQKVDALGYVQWGVSGTDLNTSDVTQTYTTVYDATVDVNGNGITVYEDSRSGNFDVYASKIYANGQSAWGTSGVTLSTGTGTDVNPTVLAMPDSSCIFAWQSDDSSGIYLQRVDAAGNKLWGTGVFYHYQPGDLLRYWTYPTLVYSSDSSFFLIYRKSNAAFNPSQSNLAVMKYNTSGQQLLSAPVTMQSLGAFGIILRMKVISDGQGGFYAAWLDGRNSGFSYDGFVQHMDEQANPLYAVNGVRVSSIATSDQIDGIIPVRCAGRFYAVFYNGTANYISVQKFDDNGNLLFGTSAAVIVSTPSLSVNYTQLNASAAPDGIIITYAESQTVNNLYYACKSDTNGQSAWSTNILPVSNLVSGKSKSTLTAFQNNMVVLCWQDDRSGQDNVYVQNITNDGDIGTGITGVNEESNVVYPNPTTGLLYGRALMGRVQISDLTGRILDSSVFSGKADLSSYPPGVYFLQFQDGRKMKVIVERR